MTVLAWFVSSFLVVAVTLIAVGLALRPYVADLQADRNAWRLRAEVAEAELEAAGVSHDVRIINPRAETLADIDIFMKGTQ